MGGIRIQAICFIVAFMVIFTNVSGSIAAQERIAGWGDFLFNMSKTDGEILLSLKCKSTKFELADGAFSEGKNCGKFLENNYDLRLYNATTNGLFSFFRERLVQSITLSFD